MLVEDKKTQGNLLLNKEDIYNLVISNGDEIELKKIYNLLRLSRSEDEIKKDLIELGFSLEEIETAIINLKSRFKVSSGLKDIIGRDLIFESNIAVFELVKNSFDARAKRVDIIFDTDRIVIKDNGKGMTTNDLFNKWLVVAYSAKKEGTEDEDYENLKEDYRDKIRPKKHYAGAKGIGRFSCDSLGKKLKLITKSKQPNSKIEQIEVNWEDFQDKPKEEFVNIPVKYSTPENIEYTDFEHGTILEITGLRSIWNHKEILKLKHSLEKLINPFGSNASDINAFDINIEANYLKRQDNKNLQTYLQENPNDKKGKFCQTIVNGKVQNFIFETLNVKTTQIYSKIDERGEFITTELIDRDVLIFKIKEENPYKDLKNIHFRLFYLNRIAKQNFSLIMKIPPVQFGSIFLFKNGFRVFPYGETGDDSFGIDRRRSQGHNRFLGTRDLLGKIDIIGNNPGFRETSSRSGGLIETSEFIALKKAFIENCFKRLEKYVVDVQWAKAAYRELDKFSSGISTLNNLEAKALMINVISKIIKGKDVELLDYDKEFLNVLNEKIQDIAPDVFSNLEEIAKKTGDKSFLEEIRSIEERYVELQKKLEAEEKARIEAEEKARIEVENRIVAEEKNRKAQEEKKEEERKRLKAENDRLKEEIRRKDAEEKARQEKVAKEKAQAAELKAKENLFISEKKNLFLSSIPRDLSLEAQGLVHHIHAETEKIDGAINEMIELINSNNYDKKELLRYLSDVKLSSDKALKISSLITRANFNKKASTEYNDLAQYIIEYIENYKELNFYHGNLIFHIKGDRSISFERRFSVLEISIIFDNLITNAQKANAENIYIYLSIENEELSVLFEDDGQGVLKEIEEYIFELGITTTYGSGIGLYTIKDLLKEMNNSSIEFVGNNITQKGAMFKIKFSK